jgi:hypothetical protein
MSIMFACDHSNTLATMDKATPVLAAFPGGARPRRTVALIDSRHRRRNSRKNAPFVGLDLRSDTV